MNILLIGPQGSGKGTQARILTEKYGYYYFESGEYLEKNIGNQSGTKKMVGKREVGAGQGDDLLPFCVFGSEESCMTISFLTVFQELLFNIIFGKIGLPTKG